MSKYIPGNQKHLTLDDRIYIENSLNKGCTFKVIAKCLWEDSRLQYQMRFLPHL
ncbi:MAG: helix-turn-helix domain-containing protein [Clostridium sp.]|nr:helix-turn-helix domain-containing protein [Clostridium sp.]